MNMVKRLMIEAERRQVRDSRNPYEMCTAAMTKEYIEMCLVCFGEADPETSYQYHLMGPKYTPEIETAWEQEQGERGYLI